MSKQTAVEWLVEQLNSSAPISRYGHEHISISIPKELIDQAQAMEREQAREHYIAGFSERDDINSKLFFNPLASQYNEKRFEEYYNKFKGGEQ